MVTFPSARKGQAVPKKQSAERTNGPARKASRGRGENSNAATVRSGDGSGFIAAIRPATVEIFSAKSGA
jgi:hypothetical protein